MPAASVASKSADFVRPPLRPVAEIRPGIVRRRLPHSRVAKPDVQIPTKSARQLLLSDVLAAQRLKRRKRLEAPLELNGPSGCFSGNAYSFVQQRFKMNPRFTWLCRTDDDPAEWRQAIRVGIGEIEQSRNLRPGARRLDTSHRKASRRYCTKDNKASRPQSVLNHGGSESPYAIRTESLLPEPTTDVPRANKGFVPHRGRRKLQGSIGAVRRLKKDPGMSSHTVTLDCDALPPEATKLSGIPEFSTIRQPIPRERRKRAENKLRDSARRIEFDNVISRMKQHTMSLSLAPGRHAGKEQVLDPLRSLLGSNRGSSTGTSGKEPRGLMRRRRIGMRQQIATDSAIFNLDSAVSVRIGSSLLHSLDY